MGAGMSGRIVRILLLFAVLATASGAGAVQNGAVPRIAVLNPAMDDGLGNNLAGPITDKILEQLLKSRKFNILDRASRDLIWEERNFQLSSGEIRQSEIKAVGEGLGADFVVVVKVTRIGSLYSLSATMINVETLEIVAQSSAEADEPVENLLGLASYCGEEIAASYGGEPLKPAAERRALSEREESIAARTEIRAMLQKRMFLKKDGQAAISAKVGALIELDRTGLYHEFKKDRIGGLLGWVNVFPFALGSLFQGDFTGFMLWGGCQAIGAVAIIGSASSDSDEAIPAGAVLYAVGWIASWFRPGDYVRVWNKKLAKSLNVITVEGNGERVDVAFLPGGFRPSGVRIASIGFSY